MYTSRSRGPGGANWFNGAVALLVGLFVTVAFAGDGGEAPARNPGAVAATHDHDRHADPRTEPDWPMPPGPGDDDYSDAPLTPDAWHQVQHLEWLGDVVDGGEIAPNVPDDHILGVHADDDGLLSATIGGGVAKLEYRITTNYTAHMAEFIGGNVMYVDGWIDWNGNTFFAPGEHLATNAHVVPGPVALRPFGFPAVDSIVATLAGPAGGAAPGVYNIRLRVDWHAAGIPAHVVAAGGNADGGLAAGVSFGEVEDYEGYLIVPEPPPVDRYFCSMLSAVGFDASGELGPGTSLTLTAQTPVSMELGKDGTTASVVLLNATVDIEIGPDDVGVSEVTITGGSGQFDAYVFGGEPVGTSTFKVLGGGIGSITWITNQIEIEELSVHVSAAGFSGIVVVASGLGQIDVDTDTVQLDVATGCLETYLIPATSDWGLVVMTLLVLMAGTIVYMRRRAARI